MKIRAYLMLLVGVAFLPLLIISLIGGVFIVKTSASCIAMRRLAEFVPQ